jgi:hypothetical protein
MHALHPAGAQTPPTGTAFFSAEAALRAGAMQTTPVQGAHGRGASLLGSLAEAHAGGATPVPQPTPGTMVRLESASSAMAGMLLQSAAKGLPAGGAPAPCAVLPTTLQQTAPALSSGLPSSSSHERSHERSHSSFGFWKQQQQQGAQQGAPASQVESQTVSYGGFFQLPQGQAAPSTAATGPAAGLDCQQTVSFTGFLQQQQDAATTAAASTADCQQAAAAAAAACAAEPSAGAAGGGPQVQVQVQAAAGGPGFGQFFSVLKASGLPEQQQPQQQQGDALQQVTLPAIRTSSLALQRGHVPGSSADNTPHSHSQAASFAFAAAQPELQSYNTPTSTQASPFGASVLQQH